MTKKRGNLFARFVVDNSKINEKRVHFTAFQPPRNLELSVHTIDSLDHKAIVDIGQYVAEKREKNLKGWARTKRSTIYEVELEVVIDNKPILGHAKIIGWPDDVQTRKNKMKHLAARSQPVLKLD